MFFAVRIEWPMSQSGFHRTPFFKKATCVIAEISVAETLPYILYSLVGRVKHVFAVESVVAQLVVHYLVSREVFYPVVLSHHLVGSKQKHSL